MAALLVFLGGGLGSVARWWVAMLVSRYTHGPFPLGTLLVNLTGSFAIGFLATWTTPARWGVPDAFRQFFMIGLCGGYTTFSSFSLQTLELTQQGEWIKAGANVVLSVVGCLAAVALGHLLATHLNPPGPRP